MPEAPLKGVNVDLARRSRDPEKNLKGVDEQYGREAVDQSGTKVSLLQLGMRGGLKTRLESTEGKIITITQLNSRMIHGMSGLMEIMKACSAKSDICPTDISFLSGVHPLCLHIILINGHYSINLRILTLSFEDSSEAVVAPPFPLLARSH